MNTPPTVPIGLKKVAALSILRSPAGLLLLHRTKEPHQGKYIPIGGKLEPFETPGDAAVREIYEETGIRVHEVKLCGIMSETSPTSFNWVNYIYSANIDQTAPIECEEGVLEWIPDYTLENIPTPETDLHIYSAVAVNRFFVFNAIYDSKLNLLELSDEVTKDYIVNRKQLE